MATVLESSKISPSSPGWLPELSLPLVFFDMVWYGFPANQIVLLFDYPCSKTHFLNSIVPHLKKSLSLTLTHFLPLAGNIIHPLNPLDRPVLRYQSSTDSVSFTVSESDADLTDLTGNHPRNCDEFYTLAPLLPPAAHSDVSVSCPVLAIQVTVSPGKGFSISFVMHHAIFDASTVVSLMQAWALISRMGENMQGARDRLREANLLPFLDRKTVTNINGLDSLYWDLIVKQSCSVEPPPPLKLPINKLRATFVLKREEIEKLKSVVRAKIPSPLPHISSFTVACALVWTCYAKSAAAGGEDVAADEPEYFGFQVDCRGRLKPPLPANYLGACVAMAMVRLKHGQLKGADGFVTAAVAVGAAVQRIVKNDKGVVDGAENWPEELGKLAGKRQCGVAGSPRFDMYATDFGWGKPRKCESLSIDSDRSMSLWKSRDFEGALDISLSLSALQMDAFANVFNRTLADLLNQRSFLPLVSRY